MSGIVCYVWSLRNKEHGPYSVGEPVRARAALPTIAGQHRKDYNRDCPGGVPAALDVTWASTGVVR